LDDGSRGKTAAVTRTLLAIVLAAVALGLTACGGEDDDAATPPAATSPTEEVTTTAGEDDDGGDDDGGEDGEGDAEAGASVFASAGCGGCHTLDAAGSSGTVGPNLDDADPDFDRVVEMVTNGSGQMPSFEDQLTEKQIRDVAAYVSESAGS
jgi:mono/diheme cytochrome c family protein